MNSSEALQSWVRKKPLCLIKLDQDHSDSLNESKQGFEHLTFAKPHATFQDFCISTFCLMEAHGDKGTRCYLGTVTRKRAVTTFDSSVTIKKLRLLSISSLEAIKSLLSDTCRKTGFEHRLPEEGGFTKLSPKLSAAIIDALAGDSQNQSALDTAFSLLPGLRKATHATWAQEDAISTAMAAFGLRGNVMADSVALKLNSPSGLGLMGSRLYEDNVVRTDGSEFAGFEKIGPDVTGRAVFTKGDERLVIYTANKLPLEKMLGVDLIYINETRGSVVMLQYKMLEPSQDGQDWIYRPDDQLDKEIKRMQLPPLDAPVTSYRLSRSPFLFKFVKRVVETEPPQSFVVALDHLMGMLARPEMRGINGGIRLSYNSLDGGYLRQADFVGLLRSGYIGTHREETEALAVIIDEAAKGNKALVLAWQQKIDQNSTQL